MINKIKSVELIEEDMLQQMSKDIFLVNAIPPNTFANGKGILISNPQWLTEKLLSVSAGVSKGKYTMLYVALLVEMVEQIKSMSVDEKDKTFKILKQKENDIKFAVTCGMEKKKIQLLVPEETLDDINGLIPDSFKYYMIPALIDHAINLKEQSGNVFLFESNHEGEHYEN